MNKGYDIQKLLQEAKKQGYKLAALENASYERLVSFNNLQTPIDEQLKKIFNRLKSEVLPDGVYYVLMATSISTQKKADRFPTVKGNIALNENEKATPAQPIVIHTKAEEVLTWDAALALHKEISDLKAEVARLKLENSQLYEKIEEYEAEEEEGFSEGSGASNAGSDVVSFLKETAPTFLSALDRYFDLQEKKLELQKQVGIKAPIKAKVQPKQPSGQGVGSQAHVNYMRKLFAENQDDALNAELDKIEKTHPELYNLLCTEFGMIEEEEEEHEDQ